VHNRQHTMIGADHIAGTYKLFVSDGSGNLQEVALGAAGLVLVGGGVSSAPAFAPVATPVNSVTATTATTDVNLNNGLLVKLTLTCDTVINFTNPPASGVAYSVILMVTENATGGWGIDGFQISGSSVTPEYQGGTATELTGTASSRDDLHVIVENAALTVKLAGGNMS